MALAGYRLTKEVKLSVLQDFLKTYQYILPKGPDNVINAGILWHNNLHIDNIFVDQANPTEIPGIIDWQVVNTSPMFLTARHPSFIEYDEARLERFFTPRHPEDIDEINAQDRKAAWERYIYRRCCGFTMSYISINKHRSCSMHSNIGSSLFKLRYST